MSRKNKRLREKGISHEKYMELVYFCLQYREKREQLQSLSFIKSIDYGGVAGSGGGKPTEKQAIHREELKRDIELIERTVLESAPEIYSALLKNVTEGVTYIYLDVPCSKKYFYAKRREFFIRLAMKK